MDLSGKGSRGPQIVSSTSANIIPEKCIGTITMTLSPIPAGRNFFRPEPGTTAQWFAPKTRKLILTINGNATFNGWTLGDIIIDIETTDTGGVTGTSSRTLSKAAFTVITGAAPCYREEVFFSKLDTETFAIAFDENTATIPVGSDVTCTLTAFA